MRSNVLKVLAKSLKNASEQHKKQAMHARKLVALGFPWPIYA